MFDREESETEVEQSPKKKKKRKESDTEETETPKPDPEKESRTVFVGNLPNTLSKKVSGERGYNCKLRCYNSLCFIQIFDT